MQKNFGTEWLTNGGRKDFYYYKDVSNASSPEFAHSLVNCDWASGGIIGILTGKSFIWSDDPHLSRHNALEGATGLKSLARLETKDNHDVHVWAEVKSHLKAFSLLLSLQHLPAELRLKLYSVSSYHQSQNSITYFYGEFENLHKVISKIK